MSVDPPLVGVRVRSGGEQPARPEPRNVAATCCSCDLLIWLDEGGSGRQDFAEKRGGMWGIPRVVVYGFAICRLVLSMIVEMDY